MTSTTRLSASCSPGDSGPGGRLRGTRGRAGGAHRLGATLLRTAAERARAAGCDWLHVDFEEHLRSFSFDACGFRPSAAGLIAL
ncbi:hypothetical protein [Streptomyces sp. NBC_01317]|uniref:hypothetical protein n=1 Tax=Streptomyces sp. NBC_01317 TaxID=2903822 RepID=UPI002E0D28F4